MLRVRNVPKATWTAVAGMLAVTAVLVLVVISGRTSIRAEDPPDAPVAATTTPLVITEETMHLLPPLDLSIVPTVVPPPCVKRHMEKYSYSSNWYLGKPKITRAWGIGRPNGCALIGPDGNVISEEEADRLLAESEPARVRWEAEKQDRMQGEWASWREISLVDGSKLKLPHDVRIVDYSVVIYQCFVGDFCPENPLYKLSRGESVIWVDSNGIGFNFRGDEIDPDAFPFITTVVEL